MRQKTFESMKEKYIVFISGYEAGRATDEEDVWDIIEKRPFFAIYEVRYADTGDIAEQFIPY